MKQSVPQAIALNKYSVDCKGFCVFSSLQNYLPHELFADFALILVNSGESMNDLKPLISSLKAIKSPALHTMPRYFSKMHITNERACDSNSMSLSIIHQNMAQLLIFLPCETTSLSGTISNGNSLKLHRKTKPNKLSYNNITTDRSHWLLFFLQRKRKEV